MPILSTSNSFYLYLLITQLPYSYSCTLSICLVLEDFSLETFLPKGGGPMVCWQEWAAEAGPDGVLLSWPSALTKASVSLSLELSGTADTLQGPYVFFFMQMSPLKRNDWALNFHGNCQCLDFRPKSSYPSQSVVLPTPKFAINDFVQNVSVWPATDGSRLGKSSEWKEIYQNFLSSPAMSSFFFFHFCMSVFRYSTYVNAHSWPKIPLQWIHKGQIEPHNSATTE